MYAQLFNELYAKLAKKEYFGASGVPYHAVETVVVEAPDHGHESTSEAASLYVYMAAMKGALSGDWTDLNKSWEVIDKVFIPSGQDNYRAYNPSKPAEYAPEQSKVSEYPVRLDSSPVGADPESSALMQKYGPRVYSMHWLVDPDNMYGFGQLFNTFQRGEMEGVWNTIPQPCVDNQTSGGPNGFLDLFVSQNGRPPAQWKYTLASDADARVIQGMAMASFFGKTPPDALMQNTTKMGDFLVLSMYDKYFRKIGAGTQPGYNDDAFHGLLSWYSAWGAPVQPQGWAFRIGCSHCHSGYQNPFAAYVMSKNTSSITQQKWAISLKRQMEFIAWLQSAEGAIAGGCTNSVNGRYDPIPAGTTTFYGMAYVAHPVYMNPPSNNWSGMNFWLMERVMCYLYVSKDKTFMHVADKWVQWLLKNIKNTKKGNVKIPATLQWSGQPDANWSGSGVPPANTGLHCKVTATGQDIGVMACAARSLLIYNAISPNKAAGDMARRIMKQFAIYKDDLGYAVTEKRADYVKFHDPVYVPPGWTGTMPNGESISSGATFFSLRKSLFEKDPMYQKIDADLKAGKTPIIKVHRWWGQTEVAITYAFAALLNFQ